MNKRLETGLEWSFSHFISRQGLVYVTSRGDAVRAPVDGPLMHHGTS